MSLCLPCRNASKVVGPLISCSTKKQVSSLCRLSALCVEQNLFTQTDTYQYHHILCGSNARLVHFLAWDVTSDMYAVVLSNLRWSLFVWPEDVVKNCVEDDTNTDPWPGYRYTGKLRPFYPLVGALYCHHYLTLSVMSSNAIAQYTTI